MRVGIKIEGLKELRKALRDADRELPKQLRRGFNEVAVMVADEAAQRVPVQTGRLRDSIRPRSTQTEGIVVMGRASVPYAGWIEFGGRIAPRGTVIERPFIREGRYLLPAAKDLEPAIRRETAKVLDRMADRAGL